MYNPGTPHTGTPHTGTPHPEPRTPEPRTLSPRTTAPRNTQYNTSVVRNKARIYIADLYRTWIAQ